jgi:hypothetical protein
MGEAVVGVKEDEGRGGGGGVGVWAWGRGLDPGGMNERG